MVSKAICAGPLCEGLSLRRSLGPRHARREHVGTWETSLRPQPSLTVQGRDGKPRRRSRQGRCEESDGVVVPVKRPNKAGMTSGGGRGGKDPARKESEWTVTDSGLSAGHSLTSMALAHGLARGCRPVCWSRRTSGRSPVREIRTPGSARGAGSNSRPYRNSREMDIPRVPTPCLWCKATRLCAINASAQPTRRGHRTWHVCTLLAREPGYLGFDQPTQAGPHREGEEP